MQHVMPKACALFACALICGMSANATDYYVSTSGSDDYNGLTAETPFATVDKAVATAAAADTIYVAAGTYTTTTKNAPEVKCALVGLGETRDDVVIQSGGFYRALKTTASTACISNVTIVGITTTTTSIGGAVHMTGGTLVDCVIRDGRTTGNGGNVYVASGPVTIRDCEISGGSSSGGDGGNVYVYSSAAATIRGCVISGGTATGGQGGNVYLQGDGTVLEDSRIENGAIGNVSGKIAKGIGVSALAIGGAWVAAIEGTREYRTEMGKLDTAFVTNGHSSEAAKKTYQDLQAVLGNTDVSVEAAKPERKPSPPLTLCMATSKRQSGRKTAAFSRLSLSKFGILSVS